MRLLVLPAVGIGPEIVAAALDGMQAADRRFGLGLSTDNDQVGFDSLAQHGTTFRDEVLERGRPFLPSNMRGAAALA